MRSGKPLVAVALVSCLTVSSTAEDLVAVQQQRYCMGTIFEIIAYHHERAPAEGALSRALDEVARLDDVMSHFKAESELSRLNNDARRGFVKVSASLFEVIQRALQFSVESDGAFDITIAPLLRAWQKASDEGRVPSAEELFTARRCVGYENIQIQAPNRIAFRSPCVELDLGGIGKGFAVDRALDILRAEGINHAVINSGGSTIAAIGHPPGRDGWPVQLAGAIAGNPTLVLRNQSISTSEQKMSMLAVHPVSAGDIIDPRTAAPTAKRTTVSVVAPSATAADALSTTLLLLEHHRGRRVLAHYANVSALWFSPAGELQAAYGPSRLSMEAHPIP